MMTQRLLWLDNLRLTAGLSMVVLHTTSDATGQPWPNEDISDRIAPALLRLIAYSARTELFLMIACFLLVLSLQKRERSYKTTIVEQSQRLLVPFLFWTIFFAGFNFVKATEFGYAAIWADTVTNPLDWLRFLALGDVKYHMHFLPTLFALLLFYPLFAVAYRVPALGLLLIPCLVLKWELDRIVWPALWDTELLPFAVRAVKVTTYVGYGVAAAALARVWIEREKINLTQFLVGLSILSAIALSFKAGQTLRTIQTGTYHYDSFTGFWADFLMPVLLFAICMCLWQKPWPSGLAKIGKFSFGVYLCHPIFLDLSEIMLRQIDWAPIAIIATKLALTLTGTSILVFVLSRIRALAWTIGLGPFPRIPLLRSGGPKRAFNG